MLGSRTCITSLLGSVLFRGIDDTEYSRICSCGFLAPPKPISLSYCEALAKAGNWDFVADHVLNRKTGLEKTCESFSLRREEAVRFATHDGGHDGWILSFQFSAICNGPVHGSSQVGKPWLCCTDSTIWLIPRYRIPTGDIAVLLKGDGEYRIEEHNSFESLPALEEKKKLKQQQAGNTFADFADANSNSVRDCEVLLLFGSIDSKLFAWERVQKTDYRLNSV